MQSGLTSPQRGQPPSIEEARAVGTRNPRLPPLPGASSREQLLQWQKLDDEILQITEVAILRMLAIETVAVFVGKLSGYMAMSLAVQVRQATLTAPWIVILG